MKLIKIKRRKPNRSVGGDIGIYIMLILFGIFFVMPLVYTICSAFKPLDEIYLYPPSFFVKNPTFNNFQDMLVVMSSSYVPFTRYIFNTVFTTLVGTVGHLIFGSMAAYVLAKYNFPGSKGFFNLCVTAIMFNAYVLQIPTYLIMSKLGWVDTYAALIVPAFALPMGLFLMKQFMEQIPDALIEAAKIDGGGIFARFWYITIPCSAPMIFFNVVTMLIGTFQYNGTLMLYPPNGEGYQNSINMLAVYIYNEAFLGLRWGYGSALSWVLMVVIGIVTASLFGVRRLIAGKEE